MKVYKGKKLLADKVLDCTGFSSAIGLRFTLGFKPFDAYIIHMLPDSVLDSYFVFHDFYAVWLDNNNKVLKVELCKPWRFFGAVHGQRLVLELPNNKYHIKEGDFLVFKP